MSIQKSLFKDIKNIKPFYKNGFFSLYREDCLKVMDQMIEKGIQVDCIITDPPYEIAFMDKGWDNTGITFQVETWEKCLKVLKPGGYLVAFNHPRRYPRMSVAIEDAGFQIRDTVMWLYSSGFPKSTNISKVIDKQMGVQPTIIGKSDYTIPSSDNGIKSNSYGISGGMNRDKPAERKEHYITTPTSKQAKKWEGWGSGLKPAHEPILVARKPFKGSLTNNILENGVGGLNIDGGRVETDDTMSYSKSQKMGITNFKTSDSKQNEKGRHPANIIHDGSEEVLSIFPITGKGGSITKQYKKNNTVYNDFSITDPFESYNNTGSAARCFFNAKASQKDRNEGLEDFVDKLPAAADFRPNHMDKALNGKEDNPYGRWKPTKNIHPTVKPTNLMQYMVRLVSPKGAMILDPFMGSGSTGKAVAYENKERDADYKFIGIDQDKIKKKSKTPKDIEKFIQPNKNKTNYKYEILEGSIHEEWSEDYSPIAKARIEFVLGKEKQSYIQESLFEYKTGDNKSLRVIELFGGIGAPRKALENLDISHDVIDYVEIDKYAVQSYNAMYDETYTPQDICNWDKDLQPDLIFHGSPCQDFSLAGLGKGGEQDSGTRSSLLWETVRIVEKNKPKYVLWENVKAVINKKHKPLFDRYLEKLKSLGYTNYYEVLNAKDFGIPQNRQRVFVVSILNPKQDFIFPKPRELELKLKDMLQDNPESKYYLSEKAKAKLVRHKNKAIQEKDNPNISGCIHSGYYKIGGRDQQYIKVDEKYYDNLRIRKLTELECFRLMGFDDVDYNKVKEAGLSKTQMYKQAGNSIVVNVLEAIFEELFVKNKY